MMFAEKKRRLVRNIDDDSDEEFTPPKEETLNDEELENIFGDDLMDDDLMDEDMPGSPGRQTTTIASTPKKPPVTPLAERFGRISVESPMYQKPSVSAFAKMNMTSKTEKKQDRNQKFKEKNDERYYWLQDQKDLDGNPIDSAEYNPRTLYVPKSAWEKFTPFEKQYWEVKHKHWDTVRCDESMASQIRSLNPLYIRLYSSRRASFMVSYNASVISAACTNMSI